MYILFGLNFARGKMYKYFRVFILNLLLVIRWDVGRVCFSILVRYEWILKIAILEIWVGGSMYFCHDGPWNFHVYWLRLNWWPWKPLWLPVTVKVKKNSIHEAAIVSGRFGNMNLFISLQQHNKGSCVTGEKSKAYRKEEICLKSHVSWATQLHFKLGLLALLLTSCHLAKPLL